MCYLGGIRHFFVILSDVSSAKVGSTSPPTTWSVDEVVKFIEKSELAEHADMFKKHVSKFASYEYKSSFPPPNPPPPPAAAPFTWPHSSWELSVLPSWQACTPRKADKLGWGRSSQFTTLTQGYKDYFWCRFRHPVMAESPSPFSPEILLKFCLLLMTGDSLCPSV